MAVARAGVECRTGDAGELMSIRVPFWKDGKVLEMDGGCCTIVSVCTAQLELKW